MAKRNEGKAVLLVSADLAEVMSLADRIAVMYKGEIVGILENNTEEEIGLTEQRLALNCTCLASTSIRSQSAGVVCNPPHPHHVIHKKNHKTLI